uniref:Tumor necrosis factor receptor superfamily, member 1b n=1 Tax=Mus musculus TaxID=10090 RepID=D6RG55_MOUSE
MAPAALWVALVFELQLWATGHTVPAQVVLTPYKPEPGPICETFLQQDLGHRVCGL